MRYSAVTLDTTQSNRPVELAHARLSNWLPLVRRFEVVRWSSLPRHAPNNSDLVVTCVGERLRRFVAGSYGSADHSWLNRAGRSRCIFLGTATTSHVLNAHMCNVGDALTACADLCIVAFRLLCRAAWRVLNGRHCASATLVASVGGGRALSGARPSMRREERCRQECIRLGRLRRRPRLQRP